MMNRPISTTVIQVNISPGARAEGGMAACAAECAGQAAAAAFLNENYTDQQQGHHHKQDK